MKPSTLARLVLVVIAGLSAAAGWAQNDLKTFGTGFIVDPRGYVITNEHVVHRAKAVKIVVRGKDTFPATIVSADPDHDLALLKISSDKPLPTVPLGNSSEVKRQDAVLAIGYPFGEEAVTSTSGRIVSIRTEGADQLLVTDVVANPGNSGGPLLNSRGQAIGVLSALRMTQVENATVKAGEIYAVPISFALPLLAAIPEFDWVAVSGAKRNTVWSRVARKAASKSGGGQERDVTITPQELDAKASPAVVQILSDRVEEGQIAGEASATFKENATTLLKSYLDRMDLKYEVDTSETYPVIKLGPTKMDNATHNLRIVIDSEKQLVYMFINRYLTVPTDNAKLAEVLQALMEYNWALNIGKFEWDKSDGEIRFSYCFTTENGVGFEAFEAIVVTLIKTGDDLWPKLSELAK